MIPTYFSEDWSRNKKVMATLLCSYMKFTNFRSFFQDFDHFSIRSNFHFDQIFFHFIQRWHCPSLVKIGPQTKKLWRFYWALHKSISQKGYTKRLHKKHYMTTRIISKVYENFNTFFRACCSLTRSDFVSAITYCIYMSKALDDLILWNIHVYLGLANKYLVFRVRHSNCYFYLFISPFTGRSSEE